jgi:hypothetical protein
MAYMNASVLIVDREADGRVFVSVLRQIECRNWTDIFVGRIRKVVRLSQPRWRWLSGGWDSRTTILIRRALLLRSVVTLGLWRWMAAHGSLSAGGEGRSGRRRSRVGKPAAGWRSSGAWCGCLSRDGGG